MNSKQYDADEPLNDAEGASPGREDSVSDSGAPLNTEAAELRAQLDEARDRALRAQADWENFRKRARRELDDEKRFADLKLLADLLPVLDNMQRAIDAASKTAEDGGLLAGFKLMKQQLDNVLTKHDCQRIDALHKPFDPHLHEAISQQPSAEFAPNTVLIVAQDGYTLHERVIRPAQVVVAVAP